MSDKPKDQPANQETPERQCEVGSYGGCLTHHKSNANPCMERLYGRIAALERELATKILMVNCGRKDIQDCAAMADSLGYCRNHLDGEWADLRAENDRLKDELAEARNAMDCGQPICQWVPGPCLRHAKQVIERLTFHESEVVKRLAEENRALAPRLEEAHATLRKIRDSTACPPVEPGIDVFCLASETLANDSQSRALEQVRTERETLRTLTVRGLVSRFADGTCTVSALGEAVFARLAEGDWPLDAVQSHGDKEATTQ